MLVDKIVDKIINVLSAYKTQRETKRYINGITNSYKKLSVKKELSAAQKNEINNFYSKLLGHKVPTIWHQYFYSRTNNFSKYYFPSSEYFVNLIGRLNIYPLKRAYTDKNVLDIVLPSNILPKIYLKNINGYFYFCGKPVSKQEAVTLCSNLGEVIIKPSLTAKGKGVSKHIIKNGISVGSNKKIGDILDEYRNDFLVQECIHQHKDMSALNPTSINTIRIVTYRSGMDIKIIYTVIRIGRKGSVIDNESAGGISTIIHPNGKLGKYAYGAPGVDNVEFTDSGVRLLDYQVPSYEKALNLVKDCHYKLPYFDLLGWDISINEAGEPILIEFNISPELSQSANGPAFGEFTEEIIGKAIKRNNTYSEQGNKFMWRSF